MADHRRINPDLAFIRDIKQAGGNSLKKCYQCATCSVVCNLSPDEAPYPRKEMLLAQWGQVDQLVKDPNLWLCYQCNDCSVYCPRGAKPGDVLAAIRSYIYKHFAFPSFMGKLLAAPSALPFLFLIPVMILVLMSYAFAPRLEDGNFAFGVNPVIDFDLFLPHSSIDALFVLGNIIIFLFATVGFLRFWKALKSSGDTKQVSFFKALWKTVIEIITHGRFKECDANNLRSVAHILIMTGFVGAMATTGLVFVFIFIPHYLNLLGWESLHSFFTLPLELPHPVKILGAMSGILLFLGGGIMIFRRWADKDAVGAGGYVDQLFLYIIFLTGFTGMASWIFRMADGAALAYLSYFFHIVFVYMLLWYMPYSKFAHMIYRTLALTYAVMIGREIKCQTLKATKEATINKAA